MTARHHHALRTPDIVGGSYRDVGEHSLALEQVIFVAVAKVTRHRRIQSDAVLPLFVNQALTSRKAIFWPSRGSRRYCRIMAHVTLSADYAWSPTYKYVHLDRTNLRAEMQQGAL